MANKDFELTKMNSYTYGASGSDMFLPYFGRFPDGFYLQPGDEVAVKGRALPGTDGFSVNLTMPPPNDDYGCALHINPRFKESTVVRDVRINKKWVHKETYGGFPFRYNQEFAIVIRVQAQGYKVYVDGTHFCDFAHIVEPTKVQHICIRGNVSIHSLYVSFQSRAMLHKSEKIDKEKNLEDLDSSELKWTSLSGQTVTQAQETAYIKHTTSTKH